MMGHHGGRFSWIADLVEEMCCRINVLISSDGERCEVMENGSVVVVMVVENFVLGKVFSKKKIFWI